MKNKSVIVAVVTAAILALTGCAAGTADDPSRDFNGIYADTQDGRVVWCIVAGQDFSCDWENAKDKGEN